MSDRFKAHLALLGANLFYGAGFTVAKTIMPALIKPKGFILIRVALVTILFWFSYLGSGELRTPLQRRHIPRLLVCALFGVACNQLLFFLGLNLTSPIHASLMMLSTPILVSLLAFYTLGESFTHNKIMGLMLGVAGASLLILLGARERRATNVVLGDFLVFLNASSYALYLVLVKPLMQSYRPVIIIRWVFLIGFFMVLPFGYTEFNAIEWSLFHWGDYAALAFIVVCCTFFTYLWNIYALRILSPSTAGAYIYLQPVFAAAIAIFFFHENLSWIKVLSSLLIFTGVYLVNTKRKFI